MRRSTYLNIAQFAIGCVAIAGEIFGTGKDSVTLIICFTILWSAAEIVRAIEDLTDELFEDEPEEATP